MNTRHLVLTAVGFAVLTIVALQFKAIAGGESRNGEAVHSPPPSVALSGVARLAQVERTIRAPFVGEIRFRYTHKSPGDPPQNQRGMLYAGADGSLRLDLWASEDAEGPIVVAFANRVAWLVLPGRQEAHESAYPITASSPEGIYGVIKAQTKQAEQWGQILLNYGLAEALQSARVQDLKLSAASLSARLLLNSTFGDEVSVELVAEHSEDFGTFLPMKLSFPGSVTQFGDFVVVGAEKIVPLTIRTESNLSSFVGTWEIEMMEERDLDDPSFLQLFEVTSYPGLERIIAYDGEGSATLRSVISTSTPPG